MNYLPQVSKIVSHSTNERKRQNTVPTFYTMYVTICQNFENTSTYTDKLSGPTFYSNIFKVTIYCINSGRIHVNFIKKYIHMYIKSDPMSVCFFCFVLFLSFRKLQCIFWSLSVYTVTMRQTETCLVYTWYTPTHTTGKVPLLSYCVHSQHYQRSWSHKYIC